jgi:hypothetical protein
MIASQLTLTSMINWPRRANTRGLVKAASISPSRLEEEGRENVEIGGQLVE